MLLNKEQLEDALRCRELNCENCRMDKPNCVGRRCVEDVAETALHYLTLSERQAVVLKQAKEALEEIDTQLKLSYEIMYESHTKVDNTITAIKELSDNG